METTIYLRDEQMEVTIDVQYDAHYERGKFSGPPEDCYPDDCDMEFTGFKVIHITDLSDEESQSPPTEKELADAFEESMDRIIDECWEDYHAED